MAGARQATWIDEGTGCRETAGFVPTDGGEMFVYFHLPEGTARVAVVMCSPLHAEFLSNYRREVTFARQLAEAGHAVARFHYVGSGNSGGEPADMTFATMVRDALAAAQALMEASGAQRPAFLGTRLAALVAARAATSHPGAPVIAWEPIVVKRFLREALFARQMSSLAKQSDAKPVSEADADAPFQDILGYDVPTSWPDEFTADITEHLGQEPRPVLLVQLSPKPDRLKENVRLQTVLEERGFAVGAEHSSMGDSWWLHTEESAPGGDPEGLGLTWLGQAAEVPA